MRQIVIDTETTGLETEKGHRIIEIGCIELIDRQPTGNHFHYYLNPQREIEAEALAGHGITYDFLANKPTFADIIDELLNYVKSAELIAHNAPFDIGFLNHEIRLLNKKAKPITDYTTVFDTLPLARKMFPGQRNTLDALCKRYQVDLSERKLHGALLDAQLLAEVYLLMTGGQINLFANSELTTTENAKIKAETTNKPIGKLPVIYADSSALTAHHAIIEKIKKKSGKCLWEQES